MHGFSGSVLRLVLITAMGLAASAASPDRVWAQSAVQQAPAKGAVTARAPARGGAPATAPKPVAPAARSLSQRVFDTPWVLFPMRLAIVIVLLAVSLLFMIGGCWGAVRMAHLLRHMQWKEPPRRLKRGEFGAAGASLAFEFEEQLNVKREEDEERNRQIAWLRTSVLRLTADHNRTAAALAMITDPSERDLSHGEADDLG
jgi:hypothetical protein